MFLETLIQSAAQHGASDLHLEPALPPALRIRGQLQVQGRPTDAKQLTQAARSIIGESQWPAFLEQGSHDCSRSLQGVRCRINILKTTRGVGFAIRLFNTFEATLKRLNLHPELRPLIEPRNGLVLVCGPTGSGKSSTLAALIQEINTSAARHIVTVESPIEFRFRPRQSYIRQREVGRDTPSFQQALIDALREDPDVIMVGEMREPETMRLTLNAAETGHLVLATLHSASTVEAIQRLVNAFPADAQPGIRAQLADCLVGVVAQRLRYRSDLDLRIPECEILRRNHAVQAHLRNGDLYKLKSALEMGADHGMWSFERYERWLSQREEFYHPEPSNAESASIEDEAPPLTDSLAAPDATASQAAPPPKAPPIRRAKASGAIEIEPGVGDIGRILRPDA